MFYFFRHLTGEKQRKLASCVSAIVLLFAPYAFAQTAEEEEEYTCIVCHQELDDILSQVVVDWRKSAHAQEGILCHDCHGGDPEDFDTAMEPSKGFMKKPKPEEIPDMCAKCHADRRKMRAYNLPSDQYENYKKSVHGQKLIGEKDAEAPSCVSCHGKHNILKVADPESPVHRNNILRTCAGCHSKKGIMEKRGVPFNQYELYKTSVHGKPFFENGDQGVPVCTDCHGKHAILKPQTMRVRLVCTKCHVDQEEAYKSGIHWQAAQETGEPLCIHCHSNHGIQKPTILKLVDDGKLNCKGCHQVNSVQLETALKLFKLLEKSKLTIENTKSAINTISEWSGSGFETSHLSQSVVKAEKIFNEMTIDTHSLKVRGIRGKAKKIKNINREVTAETDKMMSDLLRRKKGLIISWLVLGVFCWFLVQRTKYMRRE